jgi:adenylate cyclase
MLLTTIINTYQGKLIKTIGDEVMATFPDLRSAIQASINMQNTIIQDTKLSQFKVSIQIGFHSGWVLEEKGDVFGDSVIIAARMVSMASSQQIFTTRSTLSQLPNFLGISSRSQGHVHIKGKQDKIEIVEILWQNDTSDITTLTRVPQALQVRARLQVLLFHGGHLHGMSEENSAMNLGRDKTSNLVVDKTMVSRNHAVIELSRNRCTLTDRSSNGTHIGIDNSSERLFIHRDKIQLHGSGIISMGCEIDMKDPRLVYYKCDRKEET